MPRLSTLALIPVLALVACGDTADGTNEDRAAPGVDTNPATNTNGGTETGSNSLIDVAASAGDFTTLLAAVDAAGLTDTLDSSGPFTVFAPTDDAFAALPEGTVDALLADIPTLTDILLYHVVDGSVGSSEVVDYSLVPTLNGSDIRVSTDGGVFVNDAQVTVTDITADNGVIHVIDTVLLPPGNIAEVAVADGRFTTLVTALTAADLVTTLSGPGPFTVFAPTDDAFAALPDGTVDALLADIPTLTDVLLYHVVADKLPAAQVVTESALTMAQGGEAALSLDGTVYRIDGAAIVITDIPASNGVIHVIDAVMLP